METSFYYFFSATPQVLAAVLALFGVFVIFKIQTLKNQLIGFGQDILNAAEEGTPLYNIPTRNTSFTDIIRKAIQRGILKDIKTSIGLIEIELKKVRVEIENYEAKHKSKNLTSFDKSSIQKELNEMYNNLNNIEHLEDFSIEFKRLYDSLQFLIKETIIWSIFTAILIIVCLTILSQGDYFLCHPLLLSITFWIIIGFIIACFSGLIYILIKSLRES